MGHNQEHKMKIPKDKIIEIYNTEYINGYSSRALSFKYGVAESYFSRWFRKLGLKTFQNDVQSRKYTCDENYFENIDTEEKAYWLGFLYADGYITNKRKDGNRKLGLSLSKKDKEHLENLNKCLCSNYPINEYIVGKGGYCENSEYCRLLITSKKLTDDLIDKGCVEHKTNVLTFPVESQVPKNLRRHFIRGYFDGDGSIWHSTSNGNKQYTIDILGTDSFLLAVMNELIDKNIIEHAYEFSKRKPGQIVSRFRFGGNQVSLRFCHYIYDNATIYLQRKYDRYIDLEIHDKNKPKPYKKECCVCGDTESVEYEMWHHGGEYDGKILCNRHYRQMLKYGKITQIDKIPTKNNSCAVCGDVQSTEYHVWIQYGEYYGKTLCRKHYDQLRKHGNITNANKAKHHKAS